MVSGNSSASISTFKQKKIERRPQKNENFNLSMAHHIPNNIVHASAFMCVCVSWNAKESTQCKANKIKKSIRKV